MTNLGTPTGRLLLVGTCLVLAAVSCSASRTASQPVSEPAPAVQGPKPTLVVLITVDQMRADYYDRFKRDFRRGFPRIFERGAVFTNAFQDHAITETAPGHASLMSGRFPRSTGITRNLAGVNSGEWPLLAGVGAGAAPFRLRGTTLFDWLQAVQPDARALSVSAKDRGAILPVGRAKQHVYWFTDDGLFTTSTWYRATLPSWVVAFNGRRLAHAWAGKSWETLSDVRYGEPDSVPAEQFGRNFTFPHRFSSDLSAVPLQVRYSPMVDDLTAQFAWTGFRELDLGAGPGTDFLSVSFSATDYVGHAYGPESREQHDNLVRLDRVLGTFLDSLYRVRDSSRILLVLSSDHGVQKLPELHGGFRVSMRTAMAAARGVVRARGGDTLAVDFESGAFFVEPQALARGLTEREVTEAFTAAALKIPGVERVDRFDVLTAGTATTTLARRWQHMFPADMRPVAVVRLKEGSIYNGNAATHGSPHDADAQVPIVFRGAMIAPGRHTAFVRTVDIAPTVAHALGITPTEPLDGQVLRAVFRK